MPQQRIKGAMHKGVFYCLFFVSAFFIVGSVYYFIGSSPYVVDAAISDGANAVNVIGQLDSGGSIDYSIALENGGPTSTGFNTPTGVALDEQGNRMFVADQSNNRVLVFNLNASNQLVDYQADAVLGQTDFVTVDPGSGQNGFGSPGVLLFSSSTDQLFVADGDNQRILIYDVSSITDGENATNVLGAPDFDTSGGGAFSSTTFSNPSGLAYNASSSLLYVADDSRSRITVFDLTSISNGEPAINVLGEPDFTSESFAGVSSSSLSGPSDLYYEENSNLLFVADTGFNRVVVYDVTSITDGEGAVNVLGQADFSGESSDTTISTLNAPNSVDFQLSTGYLFVSDEGNNRIMVFDASTITDGENAVNVLGQPDFTTSDDGTNTSTLNIPRQIAFSPNSNQLFVVDQDNVRILIYDVASITDGENATNVAGQTISGAISFTKRGIHNGPYADAFMTTEDVVVDTINSRMFVTDGSNNRILMFNLNGSNQLDDYTADAVLGQPNLFSSEEATTQAGLSSPSGLAYDATNQRLFVADNSNNRIIVYDVSTVTSGENATNVLGAADFDTEADGDSTASTLNSPQGLAYDATNQRLFIADNNNHRVIVHDVSSITDGQNADNVLGQTNMTSNTEGITQAALDSPYDVEYDPDNDILYVADQTNNRVVTYDVSTITDGENAVNVLGQPDFTSNAYTSTSVTSTFSPTGLSLDVTYDRLFISDGGDSRVVVYDVGSITDGENAVNVLGAADFVSSGGGVSQSTLSSQLGVQYVTTTGRLYVADAGNFRYMVFDAASTNSVPTVSINSATARVDGTGVVDISVDVNDAENNGSRLLVQYALRTGGSCGDESFTGDPTLSETAANVTSSVGTSPDVDNGNTYQIGTTAVVSTTATNTVQFDWNSATDLANTAGNYCIQVTPYDFVTGTPAIIAVTLDNLSPTAPGALTISSTSTASVIFGYGATSTETNFVDYRIFYRTGSSGVTTTDSSLTSSTDSNLGSITFGGASTTTLTGLATNTQYVANIFAYDTYGNITSSTAETSFYTLANAPTSVAGTADSSSQITVTWAVNGNPSGTQFEADIDTGSDCSFTADLTSCVFTGLSGGTTYTITVSSRNGDNIEQAATAITVTTDTATATGGSVLGSGGGGGAPTVSSEPGDAVRINGGAASTDNPTVRVSLSALRASQVALSEDPTFSNASLVPYEPIFPFTFSEEDGVKTLYVRFRSADGLTTDASDTIILSRSNDTVTDSGGENTSAEEQNQTSDSDSSSFVCPDAGAYKTAASRAVYYVTRTCTKRPFSQAVVFFTYYRSWDEVQIISESTLQQIPDDSLGFMPWGPLYRPSYGALVKVVNDPKVYLLLGEERYWITSESIFTALGYQWSWIEDVDLELLNQYGEGSLIDYSDRHPNYTLVKYADSPRVYRIEPDGSRQVKRYILNEAVFTREGYRFDRIVTIDAAEQYPDGADIE